MLVGLERDVSSLRRFRQVLSRPQWLSQKIMDLLHTSVDQSHSCIFAPCCKKVFLLPPDHFLQRPAVILCE